ncbi:MAG TPA: hypothetical protein VIF57_14800 [Polyangia bacterium]
MSARAYSNWLGALVLCAASSLACSTRALDSKGAPPAGADAGTASISSRGDSAGGPPDLLRLPGQTCMTSLDCASGFCVDGVCCNTTCAGECMTCTAPGKVGTCWPIDAGGMPRTPAGCAVDTAQSCGNDGTCDGLGSCRPRAVGTLCGQGLCQDGAVVGQLVCDGLGACRPGPAIVCAPYLCDPTTGACRGACAADTDCPGSYCETTGRCHVRELTAACARNADCASGFCVAGLCCNTACDGPCLACNQPGREGTCSPRPDGCSGPDASAD